MPTDTFIQVWAQAMGGSGYAVAFLFLCAVLITGCVVGTIGAVLEARERRQVDDEIRRLRAGSKPWSPRS